MKCQFNKINLPFTMKMRWGKSLEDLHKGEIIPARSSP